MGKLFITFVVLTLLAVYQVRFATPRSEGAPDGACGTMEPSHRNGSIQNPEDSPYTVVVSNNTMKAGENITVTLSGTLPFKGFLALGTLNGRVEASGTIHLSTPEDGESPISQILECTTGPAITHTNNTDKSTVEFQWTAPNVPGEYLILATFVQNRTVYWVRERSTNITVTQGDGPVVIPPEEGEETTPEGVAARMAALYVGCGTIKGCYGVPANCTQNSTCEMFVSWKVGEDEITYEFELGGKIPGVGPTMGHVSMGLSHDNMMNDDSVVGCVYRSSNPALTVVQPKSFYNGIYPDVGREDPTAALSDRLGAIEDGWVFCNFTRPSSFLHAGLSQFNLTANLYYILLARSSDMQMNETLGTEILGYHDQRVASPVVTLLSNLTLIGGPPPEEPPSNASLIEMLTLYDGCATTKGCYGVPENCIVNTNCEMFASWTEGESENTFRFQIAGRIPGNAPQGHVSFGLSTDNRMGQDSVVGCVYRGSPDTVFPRAYYNGENNRDNGGTEDTAADAAISNVIRSYTDGLVICSYTRPSTFSHPGMPAFDLATNSYHILLARAPSIGERLGYHDSYAAASQDPTLLSNYSVLRSGSSVLIQLHGAFMVIAWVMTSSMGIFVARYYKQTHTTVKPFNKALWFFTHVGGMLLTIVLTVAGIIMIFVEIGEYSEDITSQAGKAHPVLGLILTGICGLQLILGLLRPHPGTKNRTLFNWVHWTAGNIGHIVGVTCIFLVTELAKSGVQNSDDWLITVIVFVVFHVVMHGLLSAHTVWADKQMDTGKNKNRGIKPGPMKPCAKPEEAPGTAFRTGLLVVYIGGLLAISITLIYLVVDANN